MPFGWATQVCSENYVLHGVEIPTRTEKKLGVVRLTENHRKSQLRCTLQKKSITASQRHCCSELQCRRLIGVTMHYTVAMKNPPMQCGLSSNFFDHFILLLRCAAAEVFLDVYCTPIAFCNNSNNSGGNKNNKSDLQASRAILQCV